MAEDRSGEPGPPKSGSSGTLISEQVQQGAQQVTQQAQDTAGKVVDQAKQQGTSLLQNQKNSAAQTLDALTQALRQTGQSLQQQNETSVSQYVEKAAGRLETVSGYLKSHDVQDLVNQAETFARRSPALFLGGAFALGVLAARFLKSSSSGSGQSTYAGTYASSRLGSGTGYAGGRSRQMAGSGQTGTYDLADPEYGVEDVEGAPEVRLGYAPGLMGKAIESDARTGDGA
ncbi:MAG: hypothetical protein ACR2JC_06945 [Chloroflexota bacterium]|nr:MAG: hypothetical protein DLM70_11655 [Chloroflexota bacterium]